MSETDQEARLRLFLAEYERVCKRYSLIILAGDSSFPMVFERSLGLINENEVDDLPLHMEELRKNGISA